MSPEKESNPDVDRVTSPDMICDPEKYFGVISPVFIFRARHLLKFSNPGIIF